MPTNSLLFFTFFWTMLSLPFFYRYIKSREATLLYWAGFWCLYALGIFCLFLWSKGEDLYILELRKIFDMFNSLLILFGTYMLIHIKIPTYWYRFSLYLLLLAVISISYKYDMFAFYIPISVYQLTIAGFMINIIRKYWNNTHLKKSFAIIIFSIWSIGEISLSFAFLILSFSYIIYIEMLLAAMLYSSMVIITMENRYYNHITKENFSQNILNSSKDIVFHFVTDPFTSFSYISPSIKELTGYSQSSFYKNPDLYIELFSEDNIGEIKAALINKDISSKNYILPIIKKDGSILWGELDFTIIRNESAEAIAIEGLLRDVSKFKYQELLKLEEKAKLDTHLSYISHELRTPITLISGYLSAIEDGTLISEYDKNEAMKIIIEKTDILKKLIDDLEQLSKLETQQFSFDFATHKVIDLAKFLLSKNLPVVEGFDFESKVYYDINELKNYWIIADLDRINQVFSNLISNAIKYSDLEKKIVISFDLDKKKDYLIVKVRDYGIGIASDNLKTIFSKFYRDENSLNKAKGRGIGLAICKEIISSHGGKISAYSNPDFQGSSFTFSIPLYKEL